MGMIRKGRRSEAWVGLFLPLGNYFLLMFVLQKKYDFFLSIFFFFKIKLRNVSSRFLILTSKGMTRLVNLQGPDVV